MNLTAIHSRGWSHDESRLGNDSDKGAFAGSELVLPIEEGGRMRRDGRGNAILAALRPADRTEK
jgi:hypothetical protein